MNKSEFKCQRCGKCCKPVIKLTREDISRIRELGFSDRDFVERDPIDEESKGLVMKRIDFKCVFLNIGEDGFTRCKIYGHRPQTCRNYPFFGFDEVKNCKPVSLRNL